MSVRILQGDCLEVMYRMEPESVDCVVTSPPYGIGKTYEDHVGVMEWAGQQSRVIAECARVLRPGGSLCWQVGQHVYQDEVTPLDCVSWPLIKASGLIMRNRIIWTFGHGLHCSKRFSGRHETIIWASKGAVAQFNLDAVRVPQKYPGKRHYKGPRRGELSSNPLGKNPGDVWDIPNVKHNHPEKTEHPCQFPEYLVERCLLALTAPRDVVLDPYAGSGTVGAVADKLDRHAILIEFNPEYCDMARKRIEGDFPLFAEVS